MVELLQSHSKVYLLGTFSSTSFLSLILFTSKSTSKENEMCIPKYMQLGVVGSTLKRLSAWSTGLIVKNTVDFRQISNTENDTSGL